MNTNNQLSFKEMDTYLHVSYLGASQPALLLEVILRIKEKAKQTAQTRILIDCFKLSPPRNDIQRIYVGLDIASMLGAGFKVAALYPPEFTTHLAESVAINRGSLFRIFAQENEALEWLES